MSTSKDYRVLAEYPHIIHYSELGAGHSHPSDYIRPDDEVLCGTSQDEPTSAALEKIEGWHDAFTRAAMMVVSEETVPTCALTPEDVYECEGGGPR